MRLNHLGWTFAALFAISASGCADEEKIAIDKLPKAITDTLKAKYPKAELVSAEKEIEDGKTVYEVKIKNGDKKLEITLSEDGKILEEDADDEKKKEDKAEKVDPDKLPKAVADAVKARFPGAEIKKAEKETVDGKVIYDIEMKHKGLTCEMDLLEDGTVLEVEVEVPAKDVPDAVNKAIEAKYPKSKVDEVMAVHKVVGKEEKLLHYEVTLKTADNKEVEVLVSPDGKSVKTEEEAEKEKAKK